MKKLRISGFLAVLFLAVLLLTPAVYAADDATNAVIAQLEAIDSLAEMQAKRRTFTVSQRYDALTTDSAVINSHLAAQEGYATYVEEMFAARKAAQQAYDALTPEQQAQIDPALVAKLSNELDTVLRDDVFTITPQSGAYCFELVGRDDLIGYGYELGYHMLAYNKNGHASGAQTFILVDTTEMGAPGSSVTWQPDGLYVPGESDYEVLYCCDFLNGLTYGSHYKRSNLEGSGYFSTACAEKIRAIVLNSYPYVTIDEMKANLKAGGLSADLVDSLTRADIISGVQLAIWYYSNPEELADRFNYFCTLDVETNNAIRWFTLYHDYTSELWDWLPGGNQRTYDAETAFRVENLAWYLANLEGIPAEDNEFAITSVQVTRADLQPGSDDAYQVGMYVYFNGEADTDDNLTLTVTSHSTTAGGERVVTGTTSYAITDGHSMALSASARVGDTIEVVVQGTQNLGRNVYFYEAEEGRDEHQTLVGVAEGKTKVYASRQFVFEEDIEKGLRLYKTEKDSGLPISEIEFHIYQIPEGETISSVPTEAEVEKYAVDANHIISLKTDSTGYAYTTLEDGYYLVQEVWNAEKVKYPVDPFYIRIPMPVQKEGTGVGDVAVEIEYKSIVSVYPKNEPVDTPPPPPPPRQKGRFQILKHEEGNTDVVLEGATFQVYRLATEDDPAAAILTITCEGETYQVVPAADYSGNSPVSLVTGEDGKATSPDMVSGIYYLVETKAPWGYIGSEEAFRVTAHPAAVAEVVYEIPNTRGTRLPETGGQGTRMLMLCGGLFTVGAAVLLVTRKRMNDCT